MKRLEHNPEDDNKISVLNIPFWTIQEPGKRECRYITLSKYISELVNLLAIHGDGYIIDNIPYLIKSDKPNPDLPDRIKKFEDTMNKYYFRLYD